MINMHLANSRNLDPITIDAIEELNRKLDDVLTNPNIHCQSPREAITYIAEIEYKLQKLWKFDISPDHQKYWFRVTGCTCPKLDNEDTFGTPYKIKNGDCPYHGINPAESWSDERFSL